MTTCESCRDRLLDYAYGLLEEGELQELHEHLSFCADCQAELEVVRADQHLLARAAQAITNVPEFALPPAESMPASVPETMPIATPERVAHSTWRRTWMAWGSAAAVLVAILASFSWYRNTIHGLKTELASRRDEYKQAAAEFAALPVKYGQLQHLALSEVNGRREPYIHIVGPTTLTPGAQASLRINALNFHADEKSKNLPVHVRVQLVEEVGGKVAQELRVRVDDKGQARAELDAKGVKPNTNLRIVVEADSARGSAKVEQPIRVTSKGFVARLETNKIAYQHRDVLFFRGLVLDRFTLQPPSTPILMRVELRNSASQVVRMLDLTTGPGGVLANEFGIDDQLHVGDYTLQIRPVNSTLDDVQSLSRRLHIFGEPRATDLVLDRFLILPGEKLSGVYTGPGVLAKIATIGPEAVPLVTNPQPGIQAAPGGYGGKGAAPMAVRAVPAPEQRFWAAIPRTLPAGVSRVPITFKVGEGKQAREIRREIQIASTDLTIDLFPEGGDLVAGLPNRVFFRVRSQSGEPAPPKGKIVLLPSKKEPIVANYRLGMGSFVFTPDPKEKYSVRIETPGKTQTVANPFASLGIRPIGMVLYVPTAVLRHDESIRGTIRHRGPNQKLLVLAQCRGQIVDQRWIDVKPGDNTLTLDPVPGAVGMIRVTVHEMLDIPGAGPLTTALVGAAVPGEAGKVLAPVAERLVYRSPTKRLAIDVKWSPRDVQPGRGVIGTITARDEKGQPSQAWVLASVVDQKLESRSRGMSAYFLVLNDAHSGAQLDDATIVLNEGPESVAMLERFLGTHGWRRYSRAPESSPTILPNNAALFTQPRIFSRENHSLEGLRQRHEDRVAQALAPIRVAGFQDEDRLKDRVASLAASVNLAGENLHRMEQRVQDSIRLSLGLFLIALLVGSLILMGVGVYRILRAHRVATPCFGSAFVCLILCVVVYFTGGLLGGIEVFRAAPTDSVERASLEVRRQLDEQFAEVPRVPQMALESTTGAFPVRAFPGGGKEIKAQGLRVHTTDAAVAARVGAWQRLQHDLANAAGPRGSTFMMAKADQAKSPQPPPGFGAMDKRFVESQHIGKMPTGGVGGSPMAMTQAKSKKAASASGLSEAAGPVREFAYQFTSGRSSDTLLWHPSLGLATGQAEVRFDMPSGQATYRVLLLGHDSTGRLGFFVGEINAGIPAQ